MTYDLCAIGNALVDIIVTTNDEFLRANGVVKGGMTLVDDARANALYEKAGAAVEMSSGGSAANTLAGFASFGGQSAFMGKVGKDNFGHVFTQDKDAAQHAFYEAASYVHAADKKLSVTLSDTFCVMRHREAFLKLIQEEVDIVFANESEIKALYDATDLKIALDRLRMQTEIGVVTLGDKGAVIIAGVNTYDIAAYPVSHVVDTTGAGDLFAAGFLFGLSQQKGIQEAGRLGALAAAEVISHFGPRPQKKLSDLV
jgi:sugar/nucleoside kinase (ribokinase family)